MAVFSAIMVPKNSAISVTTLNASKSSDVIYLGTYTIFAINATGDCHIKFGADTYIGVVDTSTTDVTWVSGDTFDKITAGQTITINKVNYTVNSVTSNTTLTISSTAGTQSSVSADVGIGLASASDFRIPSGQTPVFDTGHIYNVIKVYNPTAGNINISIQPLSKY